MGKISKERILLPRVIYGNRGDILSRWGLINGLYTIGKDNVHIFAHREDDLPERAHDHFDPYGKFHNLLLSPTAKMAQKQCDRILWGGGLDMTDESSLSKLMYILVLFSYYRMLGKEVDCVFQGAGPIKTRVGEIITREIVKKISLFIARDKYSYELIHKLNPSLPVAPAGDAIFLPGFEDQIVQQSDTSIVKKFIQKNGQPIVAVNMRRWFHFSSDLIPFQLAKKRYENRGHEKMNQLVNVYIDLVHRIRDYFDAKVLLVSAYNPGIFSWEDDMPWLEKIKCAFPEDREVKLLNEDISMMNYVSIMSKVDLAISMRLHSSLTTLRFGNPAINVSYSEKGNGAFQMLGLENNALNIDSVMQNPLLLWNKAEKVLKNQKGEKEKVLQGVNTVMATNLYTLKSIFSDNNE